jgi:hypothetical protein
MPASLLLVFYQNAFEHGDDSPARPFNLPYVLQFFLNAYPQSIVGKVPNIPIPGDLLARYEATPEQLAAELQKILQNELHQPIALSYRDVQRSVIVLSGQWKFSPANSPFVTRSETRSSIPRLQFFQSEMTARGDGSASGTAQDFANRLGDSINKQIVIDATGLPRQISWKWNDSVQQKFSDFASVLNHLKDQTGLSWSEEIRTVRCLCIDGLPAGER